LVSRVCPVASEPPEALVTKVQQDFKVCLAPQEVLVGREQLVSRVHLDFLESTVTQAVKVYKAPKDQLVFLVDLEHKALLDLLVCLEHPVDQVPPDLLEFKV
jgi:hypothetical protein